MKLKRFLLRYYPPGVILEYELRDKTRELKEIDLLHLTPEYARIFPRSHEIVQRRSFTLVHSFSSPSTARISMSL